ncbi:MAG: hypothetical protein KDN05_06130 [Verrucomicrobiae bacterium]|nr:hypothetical protein [Verrucomicrobiae bacterium]
MNKRKQASKPRARKKPPVANGQPLALTSAKLIPWGVNGGIDAGSTGDIDSSELRQISHEMKGVIAQIKSSALDASQVKARYLAHLDFIRSSRKDIQRRDCRLLEIFLTGMWKLQYESLEKFAAAEADITVTSFRKAMYNAQIRLQLADAGIDAYPTRRQAEQLSKLTLNHWVTAWKVVLERFATSGSSDEICIEVLREYCRKRRLKFYDKPRKMGHLKPACDVLMLPFIPNQPASETNLDWGNDNNELDLAVRELIPSKGVVSDRSLGRTMLGLLRKVAGGQSTQDAHAMNLHRVMSLIGTNEPNLAIQIWQMALRNVFEAAFTELRLSRLSDQFGDLLDDF